MKFQIKNAEIPPHEPVMTVELKHSYDGGITLNATKENGKEYRILTIYAHGEAEFNRTACKNLGLKPVIYNEPIPSYDDFKTAIKGTING